MEKRRERVFILRNFQFWFIVRFTLYSGAYLAVLFGGLFVGFYMIIHELLNLAGLFSREFVSQIEAALWKGCFLLAGIFVILLAISIVLSVLISRKIGGPLYAFSRHLDRCVEEKKLAPVKFREGDLFTSLADSFNRTLTVQKGKPESR